MKKENQLRILNRLHSVLEGYNGFDNTEYYGEYQLDPLGKLEYKSKKGFNRIISYSIETEIHTLLGQLEKRNGK